MKYYCIGIKGTGMSTLAQILFDLGNEVSGYDDAVGHKFTQDGLEERGIPIYYDQNHEIDKDTIVTYSVAFKEDHPEIQRVKNLGLQIKKYNEIMGNVIDMFKSIGVSGTHGKTSTSSMIKHILSNTIGCNYFIGAGDGYAASENEYFVVESDEFNRHFTAYHPKYSIITNIEAEHLECYKDIDDIRNTFELFANQTSKFVIANGDNTEVKKIHYNTRVIFYGFEFNNDVVIKNLKLEKNGSIFDLYIKEELYGSFEVPLFGKHMVLDSLAAIMVSIIYDVDKEIVKEKLINFSGAARRFNETKIGKTIIIDDYAHHPTEISATLDAATQKHPGRGIVAVFLPNTYSRTKDFMDSFAEVFNEFDYSYIMDIKCDRERPEDYPGVTSDALISKIRNSDKISTETLDTLLKHRGQVICFMSCANITPVIEEFKQILKRQ